MQNQQKIQFIERSISSLKESLNKGMPFFRKFEDIIKNIQNWKEFQELKKIAYSTKEKLDLELETANKTLLNKSDIELKKILKYISKEKLSGVDVFSKISEDESGMISASFMEIRDDLDSLLLSLKGRISGRIHTNQATGVDRWNMVSEINRCLYNGFDKKHRKFVSKYILTYKNNDEIVESFFNIPELKDFYTVKTKIETEENTKFWYTVFYICEVYEGMNTEFKYEEHTNLSYARYMSAFEWDSIKKNNHGDLRKYFSFFNQDTIMLYVEGIANDIYSKLLNSDDASYKPEPLRNDIKINNSLLVSENSMQHKTYHKSKKISKTKFLIIEILHNSYLNDPNYKILPETIAKKIGLNKDSINNEILRINNIILELYNLPKGGKIILILGKGKSGYSMNPKVYKI